MVRQWLALSAALCLACSFVQAQTADPNTASVIRAVNIDTLSRFVQEITGVVPVTIEGETVRIASRDHMAPVNWAAEYLCLKLQAYGYTVHNQYYGEQGRNIFAFSSRAEAPAEYYILSAHYDAFPYLPDAPGADDDASGVAIVLEAARLLKDAPSHYGLMFALWDEEEVTPGMFGSRHYADSVALVRDSIRGVINCELLGWDGNNDDAMTIHVQATANSQALGQTMLDVNAAYMIGLQPSLIDPGERRSDHASFWDAGYGALMQVQDAYNDFNPGYHSYNDVFSAFSLPYYHKMARLAIGTIATLVEVRDALPVELQSFHAREEGGIVRLRWKTASERGCYGFGVERSACGAKEETDRTWAALGFVEGTGTTSLPHEYRFDDPLPDTVGSFAYRLKQIDQDGQVRVLAECRIEHSRRARWELCRNYPNPFNPSTTIAYEIEKKDHVTLAVYDLLGRRTSVLVDQVQEPGRHVAVWNATDCPSGVYLYRLQSGGRAETKRMLLVR